MVPRIYVKLGRSVPDRMPTLVPSQPTSIWNNPDVFGVSCLHTRNGCPRYLSPMCSLSPNQQCQSSY